MKIRDRVSACEPARGSSHEKLPRELVWDGAHVSEIGLTCLADGQESLVDRDAVHHVEACEWCAGRFGRAALLAEAVGRGVVAVGPLERPASSRAATRVAPKPWRALAGGVMVAVLAGLPVLAHPGRFATIVTAFFTRGVPVLARGGYALASSQAVRGAFPAATLVASALLVAMGLMVASAARRQSGGVGGSLS
jgi:hypothetical protein